MENWQYELDKARQEGERAGYAKGVTVGYKNGTADAIKLRALDLFTLAAEIGYRSHLHDLMDVLEGHPFDKPWTAEELLTDLEPIEQVRIQTNSYTYGKH